MTAAMAVSARSGKEEKSSAAVAREGEERSPGRREPLVHSQVRKIREEDLRIGDGPGEGLSARDIRIPLALHNAAAAVSTHGVLCSRSAVLPSSPLGTNKTTLGSAA